MTTERICKHCIFLYEHYNNPYVSNKNCGISKEETSYNQTCEYFKDTCNCETAKEEYGYCSCKPNK